MAADQKLCIDSWRGRNVDNNKMIVWTCHKGQNQKYNPVTTATRKWAAKPSRISSNKKFQIVTRMRSKRVLYYNEHIGSAQFRLRIRKPKGDNREWWVYDSKTQSIRLANNKRYALSNQNGRL